MPNPLSHAYHAEHTHTHTHAHAPTHAGASWYIVSSHDIDVRGVLGMVRAPERAAATACALDLLRLALCPHSTGEGNGGTGAAKAEGGKERGAGTVAAAKNIAGLESGALLRVPRKQLVLQVYSADGEWVWCCKCTAQMVSGSGALPVLAQINRNGVRGRCCLWVCR